MDVFKTVKVEEPKDFYTRKELGIGTFLKRSVKVVVECPGFVPGYVIFKKHSFSLQAPVRYYRSILKESTFKPEDWFLLMPESISTKGKWVLIEDKKQLREDVAKIKDKYLYLGAKKKPSETDNGYYWSSDVKYPHVIVMPDGIEISVNLHQWVLRYTPTPKEIVQAVPYIL